MYSVYTYIPWIYIYTHTRIVEVGCASYLPCCCWGHPCLAPGRMALVKDWWSMGLDVFEWNVNFFLFIGSKQELWMWFLIVESDGQKRHTAYCFNLFQVFQQQNMVRCFNFRCGSLHDARLAAEVEVWEEELGLWLVDGKMQVSGPGRADHWRLPWWCSCLFLPLPSLCRCFSLSNSIYSYIKGIHIYIQYVFTFYYDLSIMVYGACQLSYHSQPLNRRSPMTGEITMPPGCAGKCWSFFRAWRMGAGWSLTRYWGYNGDNIIYI